MTTMHPALRKENIHAQLKLKYQRPPMARTLFRDQEEITDTYTDVLTKDYTGAIGEISGDAGFKEIKSLFEDVSGRILGFGGCFKVSQLDEKLSRVSVASQNMKDFIQAMKRYYEDKVLAAIYGISGESSFDGSNWTSGGDPFSDIEKAIGLVEGASGMSPDILIMNRTMFYYLSKFKEYREFSYLGSLGKQVQGGFMEKTTPNGLKLVVFPDAIASTYIPTNTVLVTKQGQMGVNHSVQGFGFTTKDVPDPNNPLMTTYFGWEFAKPVIDKIDALNTCRMYGLNA